MCLYLSSKKNNAYQVVFCEAWGPPEVNSNFGKFQGELRVAFTLWNHSCNYDYFSIYWPLLIFYIQNKSQYECTDFCSFTVLLRHTLQMNLFTGVTITLERYRTWLSPQKVHLYPSPVNAFPVQRQPLICLSVMVTAFAFSQMCCK